MGILVHEHRPDFVATVRNVDLSRPLDDATFHEIRDAFHRYAVLVFPEQTIDDEQQIAFSERFGPLESSLRKHRKRSVDRPEISDISNIDERHELLDPDDERAIYNAGNRMWHTDSSFKRVPAMASLLHAREVPPDGGETEYADLRAAWDALPAWRRDGLEALVAVHDFAYSRGLTGYREFTDAERADVPPVQQAVVRTHPATGRKALYLGSHASHVVGWPLAKGRILLLDLLAHATQPEFVYRHTWRVGDLVMWDNRCVLHRGRPWHEAKHRRVMHRTTVAGMGPTAVDGRPV